MSFLRFALCGAAVAAALLGPLQPVDPVAAQQIGSVSGLVVERNGTPIDGVIVFVVGTPPPAVTDPTGAFALSSVPAGRQQVQAQRLGYATRIVTVTVPVGGQATIRIELERAPIEVARVTAIGSPEDLAQARKTLRLVPGAVDLVDIDELERTRLANFSDVLRFTPGVWVQPRFGAADESQMSIRGSGLRNNFHLRGVNVLVNGMPYRNADGFTDFESLELLTTSNIQVYKGGNALRFGGSTLGGAVNLETKTGYTASPLAAFAQGGPNGFFKGQLGSGSVRGGFDYYGSYAYTGLDGFRTHSAQRRDRFNAHAGILVSPRLDLRTFYFFAHVDEDLPGSLTAEEMASDPRQAVPANVQNDWGRDYQLHHLGVQLRAQLSAGQTLEISPYFQYRDIVHPIFRVLDQVSRDVGLEVRYENAAPIGERANRLVLGFQPAWGDNDNRQFENVGGEEGALAKDQTDIATRVAFYAEDVIGLTPRLSAVLGLSYDRAGRRLEDDFLDDGDQSDDRTFEEILPKVGFLYELPSVDGQIFANVSRSFEPPLMLELNSFTVPGFVDLDAQKAWQVEAGMRGRAAGWGWQVAAYDMELRDEILNINVQPFPDAPFTVPTYRNAPDTRHYGVELGLDGARAGPLGDDQVGVQLAYTFAQYDYVEDPDYAGNEIPGAPHHVVQLELAYEHPSGVSVRPRVEWVPQDYFVDSANTATNDGWTVLGVRGEWRNRGAGFTVFVEGRNLTDEVYSPAVTVDDGAGRYYLPADGRSLYAGVRWEL